MQSYRWSHAHTHCSIGWASVWSTNESVPHINGSLDRQVQGALLQQEGHELEMDFNTLHMYIVGQKYMYISVAQFPTSFHTLHQ